MELPVIMMKISIKYSQKATGNTFPYPPTPLIVETTKKTEFRYRSKSEAPLASNSAKSSQVYVSGLLIS